MGSASVGSRLPSTIGRYEVVGRLAEGGMAEILLARAVGPSGFERAVVIKRILPHLAKKQAFVDMFLDEARLVARIRHPNVAQVHELAHDDGELYLVLEYVEGESVGGLLRRLWTRGDKLDRWLGAYVIAEACAGLHAAHELADDDGRPLGVVHRDISPPNVLSTYDGQVKVLDFGIAKASRRSTQTEAGQVKGKLAYMAPEQCLSRPLDRRADVFALGVLLYELTTSRLLFRRDNDLAVLRAICEEPIVRPTAADPSYPPELERVVLRALARPVDERFSTAAAMRRDLLAALPALAAGRGLPEEALAGVMGTVFADRVAEKREMLRRVRARAQITSVPVAEIDEDVALPSSQAVLGPASAAPSTSIADPPSRDDSTDARPTTVASRTATPRARRAPWLALGATALAAAAATAAFARRPAGERADAPHDAASGTAVLSAAAPAPASSPGPAASAAADGPAARARVVVRVETSPPGAVVRVDGRDAGSTPVDVELPRGAGALTLELSRPGFAPLSREVVPDVDQRLELTLTPVRAPPRGAPPAATSRPRDFEPVPF